MKNINLLKLFLIALLPFLIVKPVYAGFGVSPADIYSDHLKPGSSFEKEIVLSRSEADEDLKVNIETDLNEAENWFKFTPGREFVFPKGQQRFTIKINVNVDPKAELKNYKGVIRIKASSMDNKNSGVSIVKGARMEVNLVTTSIDVNTLTVKSTNIPITDWGKPIRLSMNIENSGNTEISPTKVVLETQTLDQKVLNTQEFTKLDKIPSNTTKEIFAEFKNDLDGGEYFGIVKVYLENKEIYSDRLVYKINPAPVGAKEALANKPSAFKKNMAFFKRVVDTISQNKIETVAIIFISIIPIIVGLSIYKFGKLSFIKNFFLVGTIGYVLIASALTSIYHFKWKNDFAKPSDQGAVKGETTQIVPDPKNDSSSSLIIDKNPGYPIYRTPDTNSLVVYTASENEKLEVVSEIDGWYQVLTGKGTGGWLPKNSIKAKN